MPAARDASPTKQMSSNPPPGSAGGPPPQQRFRSLAWLGVSIGAMLLVALAGCGPAGGDAGSGDEHDQPAPLEPRGAAEAADTAEDATQPQLSFDAAVALLRDFARWDAATSAERRQAAEAVDRAMRAFTLKTLDTFSAGGQRHEVAIFDHARTGLEFVLVPVGTFQMGSPASEKDREDDERQHRVTLTRPFLIARTECTQAVWDRVGGDDERKWRGARLPIENVSWDDVTAWCEKAGLRLTSQAEWEYACRAGTTTPFNVGEDITTAQANYNGNYPYRGHKGEYRERTNAVASLSNNAFGLHDMHGNVFEWCQDVYDSSYPSGSVTDPVSTSGSVARVLRGGSWINDARSLRSASRCGGTPGRRYDYIGFRPAQSVAPD